MTKDLDNLQGDMLRPILVIVYVNVKKLQIFEKLYRILIDIVKWKNLRYRYLGPDFSHLTNLLLQT